MEAKICHIEDDQFSRELFQHAAKLAGHTVIAAATNKPDALLLIDRIKRREIDKPDAFVLDANLTKGDSSGNDMVDMVSAIQEADIPALLISASSTEVPLPPETFAYISIGKNPMGIVRFLSEAERTHVGASAG